MAKGSEMMKFVSPSVDFDMMNAIRVFLKAKQIFEVQAKAEEDGNGGVHMLGLESYQFEPVGKIGKSESERTLKLGRRRGG